MPPCRDEFTNFFFLQRKVATLADRQEWRFFAQVTPSAVYAGPLQRCPAQWLEGTQAGARAVCRCAPAPCVREPPAAANMLASAWWAACTGRAP